MREKIDSSLLENWINENITNKMVKTDSVVLFTGKLEGSTWEKFDDSVVGSAGEERNLETPMPLPCGETNS